jgi:hypothetical protein
MATGTTHAFETTLGGRTVAAKIREATNTHDVIVWFCGLATPEQHIRRVAARVRAGGHDIPESRIRERYPQALLNVVELMPHLTSLRVYDNSAEVGPGEAVPDPFLVLDMADGVLVFPAADSVKVLGRTPNWAKALVEAAFRASRSRVGLRPRVSPRGRRPRLQPTEGEHASGSIRHRRTKETTSRSHSRYVISACKARDSVRSS